jgi:hypothetical protein
MNSPATIRVVIPLKIRHRNGRPRIVPPADLDEAEAQMVDHRTLRALARAWDWRRRLERGDVPTLADIARQEKVTLPFVSRHIRLAYLAPSVLDSLLLQRRTCAVPIDRLAAAALLPWVEQPAAVFDN